MLEERIEDFHLSDNPSFCALLVQMKCTVTDQYLSLPFKKESSSKPDSVKKINPISITLKHNNVTESDESCKALCMAVNNSNSMNHPMMLGLLRDHHVVVKLFETALSAPCPSNDKADFQPILLLLSAIGSSCSSSKRSWSAIKSQLANGDQASSKWQA